MKSIQLRVISSILLFVVIGLLGGCASIHPDEPVSHCIAFKTDKVLGTVKKVNAQYDHAVNAYNMTVGSVRAGVRCQTMSIPDEMEVSWQSPDGAFYEAKVPIRTHLNRSIAGQTLLFVFVPNGIEGFVEESYNQRHLFVQQTSHLIKP